MKNQKGITLVSLIITVIVMVILAGVTIGMVFNQGGLFDKIDQATNLYNQAVKNEEAQMGEIVNKIDELSNRL